MVASYCEFRKLTWEVGFEIFITLNYCLLEGCITMTYSNKDVSK